jgi:hypothetical protein
MQINEISEYVWSNRKEIVFGECDEWNLDLFTAKWAKDKPFEIEWKNSNAGWYWFLTDINYTELHAIRKPQTLPDKGCNIGLLSHENMGVFGTTLLCAGDSDLTVIYNGHEANITSRIRAHFSLNNNSTGALGIKHYPLSKKKWSVAYFSTPCFTELSSEDRTKIELLMNSYSGRCAVESAWRVNNGWPVLCKE